MITFTDGSTASPIIMGFQPSDQEEAKQLILAGLEEHWGFLDPTLNPDLNDIASTFAKGIFLVARLNGRLVGTGGLKPQSSHTAEVVRMSVAADCRRLGIGRMILKQLLRQAKALGYSRIVLETTASWADAVNFYLAFGFHKTVVRDGDQYFEYNLS
jgi:GNAT superfamily N-acetyltransferase